MSIVGKAINLQKTRVSINTSAVSVQKKCRFEDVIGSCLGYFKCFWKGEFKMKKWIIAAVSLTAVLAGVVAFFLLKDE